MHTHTPVNINNDTNSDASLTIADKVQHLKLSTNIIYGKNILLMYKIIKIPQLPNILINQPGNKFENAKFEIIDIIIGNPDNPLTECTCSKQKNLLDKKPTNLG